MEALFGWLKAQAFAVAIAESSWLFPTIETLHVIALALVLGTIALMDLRLIGLRGTSLPVTRAAAELLPWAWSGFIGAVITGSLMFSSRATDYWENDFFRIKLILLALAGLNMVVFHGLTYRTVDRWDQGAPPPGARLAGGLSLLLWLGVTICGRWIGFV
jgi:hypothetical protein